jgi:hypothetical protein
MTENRGKFVKGQKKPNQGKRGPNKVTVEFRETVRLVLESNADNVGRWLTTVAEGDGDVKPDPGKALDLLAKLAEFAAPKLARTEHVGDAKQPVRIEFGWKSSE